MSERPAWLLVVVKEKEEEEQEMGVEVTVYYICRLPWVGLYRICIIRY